MHRISNNLARLFAVAALAASATAAAAEAAVPKTGTWAGKLEHQISLGGVETTYKTSFVLSVYQGRIQTVVATVRMVCPSVIGVRDVRVLESWRTGRGPKVNSRGSYSFRADGAYFHGVISRSSAIGGASATYGEECHGTGRHNAQRRH